MFGVRRDPNLVITIIPDDGGPQNIFTLRPHDRAHLDDDLTTKCHYKPVLWFYLGDKNELTIHARMSPFTGCEESDVSATVPEVQQQNNATEPTT